VYLDGQLAGQTPVSLDRLSAGEHRVRLVKEGYIEHSRVVSISAGRPTDVQVELTRQVPSAMAAAGQVVRPPPARPEPTTQGGVGGRFSTKALLIGTAAGVGGAAAAAKKLLSNNNNKPPIPGAIGVSPTGTGIAGLTSYTFTAQGANAENGASLTYAWNFGDGASGAGQSVTHTYAAAGSYTATVTVSDGKTDASPPGVTVPVAASLAPMWRGGTEAGFNATFSVTPTVAPNQNTFGGTVTLGFPFNTTANISTGSVTPLTYPATVSFTTASFTSPNFPGVTFTLSFTGLTNAGGTAMTGPVTTTNSTLPPQQSLTTLTR
jgi:PKD repeat protein